MRTNPLSLRGWLRWNDFFPVNQPTVKSNPEATGSEMSQKAVALFQFASLAMMTQGVLLLNQLVLLPIQVRLWGNGLCAYWYSIMAVAAVTSVADLGLRSAGHAEITRLTHNPDDLEARREFSHLWAWIRILITTTTTLLVVADFLFHHVFLGQPYPLWRSALMIGIAAEVLLCVRVTYLDSQGLYREAEAGYLVLAAARLILAVGALLIFKAPPSVLAWIWFFSGIFGLVQQSYLCRKAGRLHLFESLPPGMSGRFLNTVLYTMADPCSSWVRIQGPVVILAMIAPKQPEFIVIYVALRAVFGLARQTISQLSRYASVEYLSLRQAQKGELAEVHLTLMVLLCAFFASGVAAFVIADNGRLASLWINKSLSLPVYQMIAVTFGLGNAFYAYQITQAVSRRSGEVAYVARRQYFYMICAVVFAGIALVVRSPAVWLTLMVLADVICALSFMLRPAADSVLSHTSAGWRGSLAAVTSSVLVFLVWLMLYFHQHTHFLAGTTLSDLFYTIAFFLLWILLVGVVDLSLFHGLRVGKMSLLGALVDWVQRVRTAKLQDE